MAICQVSELLSYMNVTSSTGITNWTPLFSQLLPFAERMVRKYVGYGIEQQTFTEYHPLITTRPSMSQGYTEDEEILAYEGSPQGARPIRQGRGNSRDTIRVNNLPIRSIVSINEDPSGWLDVPAGTGFQPSTQLIESRDFYVDWDGNDNTGNRWSKSGMVFRTGGIWSLIARSVQVIYVAGYTSAELANTTNGPDLGEAMDFKMAVLMTGSKLIKEAIANGLEGPQNTGMILTESIDGYAVGYAQPLQGIDVTLMNDLPVGAKRLLEERVRMSKFI